MTAIQSNAGHLMARESAQAPQVFASTASAEPPTALRGFGELAAIYTVARGSSDAAANVLSYEIMRETGIPVTSLPPSVFSLGHGVRLDQAGVLVISQSGASTDLVTACRGARQSGARTVAFLNREGSPVEREADITLRIGAGPEQAVPATKSVIGSIAAGMQMISALQPDYRARALSDTATMSALDGVSHPQALALRSALLRSQHVYVIGRDTGLGAAQEIALKLKECCALHAEAYSSSEVLHGPLQLVTKPLLVLMLDVETSATQPSMDEAEKRFAKAGGTVWRVCPSDVGAVGMTPAGAAAALLHLMYPIILETALALGHDPDAPETLAKETVTL